MVRIARVEVFAADEVAIVHLMNRTVRRCFLLGDDRFSGKNYDHRKVWIDEQLVQQARYFGIDLLCQAILSNHIHLVLRSRPDVVAEWDDNEVAPLFERLGINVDTWCRLVKDFGRLFSVVAGQPQRIDEHRSKKNSRRYHTRRETRDLLAPA